MMSLVSQAAQISANNQFLSLFCFVVSSMSVRNSTMFAIIFYVFFNDLVRSCSIYSFCLQDIQGIKRAFLISYLF